MEDSNQGSRARFCIKKPTVTVQSMGHRSKNEGWKAQRICSRTENHQTEKQPELSGVASN